MPRKEVSEKNSTHCCKKEPHLPPDLLMDAPIGIFASSPDGKRLISANKALAEMTGFSSPEKLIESINDIGFQVYADPESRKQIQSVLAKEERISDFKCQWVDCNGVPFWVSIHAKAIKDKEGRICLYQGFVTDITQHMRSEIELLEKEIEQHYIIEGSPIPSFVIGRDHKITHWNRAMEELSGLRSESVMDTNQHWKALYPEKRPCLADLLIDKKTEQMHRIYGDSLVCSEMIDGAYEATLFFPNLGENGKWLHCTVAAIYDSNNYMIGAIETIIDVTGQKVMEKELREKEERYRLLFENSPLGVLHSDKNGVIVSCNDNFTEMIGSSRDKLIGLNMPGLPDKKMVAEINRALKGGTGFYEGTYHSVTADKSTPVKAHFKPIISDEGSILGCVGVVEDITKRRLAEREREAALEVLRAITDTAQDAILMMDQQGKISFWNPAAERILGYSRTQAIGTKLHDLVAPARYKSLFENAIPEFSKSGQGKAVGRILELEALSKDGREISVELSLSALQTKDGWQAVGILRDITARKRLEDQLRQSQKMDSVGRLAGGVAHDFNNMLNVILGYTELAMNDTAPTDPLYPKLKEILNAARRSAGITRQLLAFARKQAISPKVLDLNQTVEGMLKMIRRLIGEDIDLKWVAGPGLWKVKMDPSQIDQILANLCVNARDAISGVGRISIETQNTTIDQNYCMNNPDFIPGDYVVLSVSDNGIGMDKQTLEDLFEPFFTTKDTYQGTGLGLATVYGQNTLPL
jgi:PAS domain S-box-containing protein